MWSFVTGFSSLARCFQGSLGRQLPGLHSSLWLANIPLKGYATFDLSVHRLIGIYVVSTLGPL